MPRHVRQLHKKCDIRECIAKHRDVSKSLRPGREQRRLDIGFSIWLIQTLNKEVKRLGERSSPTATSSDNVPGANPVPAQICVPLGSEEL